MTKAINPRLTLRQCWAMVNRIQSDSPQTQLERFKIAEQWLRANTVITNDEFDSLMSAATYLCREAFERM